MLKISQNHFELSTEFYEDSKTVNFQELIVENAENNTTEMFAALIENFYERKLLTTDDIADIMGIDRSRLKTWKW